MKLYFAPGACSLSPHIVLREAGMTFDLEKVDLRSHKTAGGEDFYGINPKGYVPALKLDDGSVLTEGPAILQYVADHHPERKLLAPVGSMDRYRTIEWLHFVGTELHKGIGPLWYPTTTPDVKKTTIERVTNRFAYVAKTLDRQPYLMGETFTLPDAYLYVMLRWAAHLAPESATHASLKAFHERVEKRPAVQAALKAEGLA